jgi:O-antigen ligase
MPPQLAALICVFFIIYLFWKERGQIDMPSKALWIPLLWMFFTGSRYVAGWMNLSGTTSDEGNPVNAVSFFLLIAGGIFVLFRRQIDLETLLSQNKAIWLYFLYCGISIVWSDYSFISFKRFIKELGNPIMVLVILSEKNPYQALGVILRRLSFLWLPLSVLFIKYYPAWGRQYTASGMAMGGVAGEKNALGLICLISGIYFCWNFLLNRKESFKLGERDSINELILMGMTAWLIFTSNSATALGCLFVAVGVILISKTKIIAQKPSRIIVLMMVAAFIYIVLEATIGINDAVINSLGRDSTLTNRVYIWDVVKSMAEDPLVGTGYQSFWAGERAIILSEKIAAGINQAHNGYLEQYLNLGYIGVVFIGIIIMSGLLKVRKHLDVDFPAAMLRLCFIVIAVIYNYTEASFYGLNNMWLLTLFAIIEIPAQKRSQAKMENPDH